MPGRHLRGDVRGGVGADQGGAPGGDGGRARSAGEAGRSCHLPRQEHLHLQGLLLAVADQVPPRLARHSLHISTRVFRFLFLSIGAGLLAHWKTFSLTLSRNDSLVSGAGGVAGILNCLSRLLAGAALDRERHYICSM